MSAEPIDRLDDLIIRAVAGDRDAFGAVYEQFNADLVKLCFLRVQLNWHQAEDMAHETWLRAWSRRQQFRCPPSGIMEHFKAWLSTIARRVIMDTYRSRGHVQFVQYLPYAHDDLVVDRCDVEALTIAHEATVEASIDLARLSARSRRAILTLVWSADTYQATAAQLQTTLPAIKNLIFSGRRSLREMAAERAGNVIPFRTSNHDPRRPLASTRLRPFRLRPMSQLRSIDGRLLSQRQLLILRMWANGETTERIAARFDLPHYRRWNYIAPTIRRCGINWRADESRSAVAAYLAKRGML